MPISLSRSRATPEVRERRRSVLIGLAALAGLALILLVTFTANQGHLPGARTATVEVAFTDVGQTDTNSEVRRGGERIGQVSAVRVADGHAVLTLRLDRDLPVYADARASIADQSPLAQKYVELDPGHPGAGPLTGVLPASRTRPSQDLDTLLDVFDPPTRAALRGTLLQVGGQIAGYGPALGEFTGAAPALLHDLGTVSDSAASPAADLPGLLSSARRLASRFDAHNDEVRTLLARSRQTLAAVEVDGGAPLADSLRQLPSVLPALRGASDALHGPLRDTSAAMSRLGPGADALGRATGDLRGALRESVPPLRRLPGVADDAAPAVEDLTRTVSDARPFVPRLAGGLASAATPLGVLSRYRDDIALFGDNFAKLNADHVGFAHQFRIFLGAPGPASLTGIGSLIGATREAYPAPGVAPARTPGGNHP
jgi:phospholipid/cholesterol/gamma-HCH transport system substrate-binding protein